MAVPLHDVPLNEAHDPAGPQPDPGTVPSPLPGSPPEPITPILPDPNPSPEPERATAA